MTEGQPNHATPDESAAGGEVPPQFAPAHAAGTTSETGEELSQRTRTGSPAPRMLNVCADRLLPDPLVTEVTATRYIRPRIVVNARPPAGSSPAEPAPLQRAVVPRTMIDPAAAIHRVAAEPGATWLDAQGGASLIPAWNHPDLLASAVETARVTDVSELVATRALHGAEADLSVQLSASDVTALTGGRPALLTATPSGDAAARHLEPGAEEAPAPAAAEAGRYVWVTPPAPAQLSITDLPSFLADPRTQGGIPLRLTSDTVTELLTDGRSDLPVADAADGDARVTVVVDTALANPDPSTLLSTNGTPNPATIQLAIALRWRQCWELRGYTRGALLSTISLAPQEQTTIEIFSWDRRRTETESRSSTEASSNVDTSDTVRDTTDVLNETKKTSSLSWSAQAGLTVPIASGVPLTLGGSVQDHQTMDTLNRETTNHVHEAVTKSATSVRLSRETKISETTEIGSERRVTRTVTNQNLCHVLNLDYFEVLSKYHITTSFDRAATRICALVPSPLTPSFTSLTVRAYESTLRANLLERDLLDGFDAVRMLAARTHACPVACERCTCGDADTQPSPLPPYAVTAMRTIGHVWYSLQITPIPQPPIEGGTWYAQARRLIYRLVVEILTPEIANSAWELLGATIGNFKRELTREDADRLWWAVTNAGGVDAIRPGKLAAERSQLIDDIMYDELGQSGLFSSRLRGVVDDVGMTAALDRFMASFTAAPAAAASTAASAPTPTAGPDQTARENAIREAFPLGAVTAALEREEALLTHLSNNASHYWFALWQATSSSQQATLLDGLLPPGIVEPWPIGMVDHCLAFPISATVPGIGGVLADLFGDQEPPPDRVDELTLPTPAVTMEARLGSCQACEKFIRKTRHIDLRTRSAAADEARAHAEQEHAEADRRRARLNANPPDLTPPEPAAPAPRLDVRLEQVPPGGPP
jgi:hypothetical protein